MRREAVKMDSRSNSTPQTGPLPTKDTDWHSVVIVVLGITVFSIAQGLTHPLISLLLAARGMSDLVVGLSATAFMLGLGLSVLAVPRLSGRMRAGQVIVAGLAGTALVLFSFAIFESIAAWFVLRFALGFCVNAIYVFGEAWLNVATADKVRGRVSGFYGAGMTAGFVIGPMMIPLLGTENGLAFAACAVIVSMIAFAFIFLSRRAKNEPDKLTLSDLPRFARAAPLLLLLVLIFGFADSVALALAPPHFIAGGASVNAAATFVAVMHLGMFIAQPFLGILLDLKDRWVIAAACLFATGLSFGALLMVPTTSWLVWPLGAVAGAAFFGIYTCALSILGRDHQGPMLIAGASAFSVAYALGGMVGPAISGMMSTLMPGAVFVPVVMLGIVGAITILQHLKKASSQTMNL